MRRLVQATAALSEGPRVRNLNTWLRYRLRLHSPAQATVEATLTLLLSVVTVIVVLQLSLVVAQLVGTVHVARETARWLAVRIDTIDSAVSTQANTFATSLPGLSGGGISSVTGIDSVGIGPLSVIRCWR